MGASIIGLSILLLSKDEALQVFSPPYEDEIPREPGVYGFFLLLGSRQRIGLLGAEPFSSDVLANAQKNLERRLLKAEKVFSSKMLEGSLRERGKGLSLLESYDVVMMQRNITDILSILNGTDAMSIPVIVDFVEKVSLMAGPVYCGMTYDQTLLQRYGQHKSDFYRRARDDESSFGSRFSKTGFIWDDLIFSCVPLNCSRTDIRAIEKLMHMLLKAPFSKF